MPEGMPDITSHVQLACIIALGLCRMHWRVSYRGLSPPITVLRQDPTPTQTH